MTVRLTWVDNNADETGHQIYRSTSPMDPAALPAPIATLAANVLTYDDTTAPTDTNCYYRVAAVRNGDLAVSSESMINTGTGATVETDLHWDNVVLLLHFDGTHGSTSIVDSSKYARSVINSNLTLSKLTTNLSKFGGSSFDTGNSGFAYSNTTPELVMGTAEFTAEAFVNLKGFSGYQSLFGQEDGTATSGRWQLGLDSMGKLIFFYNGQVVNTSTVTLPLNQWCHVAVSRVAGTTRVFLNGTVAMSFADSRNYLAAIQFRIAGSESGINPINGYMDEFRLTKGIGRYTADFTPPTKAFPNVGPTVAGETDLHWNNVVALLHFDGNLTDQVGTNWTALNGASVDAATKKFGGGSLYVNGVGGGDSTSQPRVTASNNPQYQFGGGDFTVEAFVYPSTAINTSSSTYLVALYSTDSVDPNRSWSVRRAASGAVEVLLAESKSSIGLTLSGGSAPVETWTHVAVSRQAGTVRLFVNGAMVNSGSYPNTLYPATVPLTIGCMSSGYFGFNGYIDEVRITKGVARYTADFTPPTKAFPNVGP